MQKKIEGLPKKPLIVVDDVVTTGQSVIDAVNALIEDDIPPIGIISVIDRQDKRNMLTSLELPLFGQASMTLIRSTIDWFTSLTGILISWTIFNIVMSFG